MRISDWSSDVCSSDLVEIPQIFTCTLIAPGLAPLPLSESTFARRRSGGALGGTRSDRCQVEPRRGSTRSEEHTSELQSLMRISYAVFCLKKKIIKSSVSPTNIKHRKANRH